MNGPLLLYILSALLPVAVAAPNHGHAHGHAHRNFQNNIQRDQGHTHGHSFRHVHDALGVPALKPRMNGKSGCGRRPKSNASGKGKGKSGSAGPSSNFGGIFGASSTDRKAGKSSTTLTSETSTSLIKEPSSPEGTTTSELSVLETKPSVADDEVVATSSSLLEAYQKSHTLATSYSAAPVPASITARETSTAVAGSGGDSGAGGDSESGPLPTGSPDYLTVAVRNMMKHPLTTSHVMNGDLPYHIKAIQATLTDGTMAPGATASMVYPSGWAGNMVAAKAPKSDDEVVDLANGSLLEGSFVNQMGDTPVGDIDISYVSGFTVPITCTCENSQKSTVTFGCSTDLFDGGDDSASCPNTCFDGSSSCLVGSTCNNPLRALDVPGLTPSPFFSRCEGVAFTYAQDTANSQNSQCTTNYISCCIGTAEDGCPAWTTASKKASY